MLVPFSLNKLISSIDPSTFIKLFIIPEKVISPPVVLTKMLFGLNKLINWGRTVFPLINLPASGNEKSITGVINKSIFLGFICLSRNPCGSI